MKSKPRLVKPALRESSIAATACREECLRPRNLRVVGSKDWMPILRRLMPLLLTDSRKRGFKSAGFTSKVASTSGDRVKLFRTLSKRQCNCCGLKTEGVPPPIYTVSYRPNRFRTSPISFRMAFKKAAIEERLTSESKLH